MGKGSSQEQETKISKHLSKPSKQIAKKITAYGNQNPWGMEYTGPQMAAVNPAQMQAMDTAAMAGNAYNMGFTPASQSLPESTNINGMETYDVLGLAKQGISPEMQGMLKRLFGGGGGGGQRQGFGQMLGNMQGSFFDMGPRNSQGEMDHGLGGAWMPNSPHQVRRY